MIQTRCTAILYVCTLGAAYLPIRHSFLVLLFLDHVIGPKNLVQIPLPKKFYKISRFIVAPASLHCTRKVSDPGEGGRGEVGGNMALSTGENIPCTGHNSAKKIWKPAFSRKNERENDETA